MADVSDTLNFFDAFDSVIQHHKASLISNKKKSSKEGVVNKVLLFKDLLTIDGNFKKPLFAFLAWVISNNEREIYLAKKCRMKFLHSQGKLSLLRVAIHPDSTCFVTKNSTDWVFKCLIGWKKHCLQLGSQSEINHAELMLASLGADPIKPQASFVLPPGADLSVIDVEELDNKGKSHSQVQCQLDERVELTETNVQIAQDIIQLNSQANHVEDRIIERFTGLFAKIEDDLQIEISNTSQDLQQLQSFHTKISGTDSEDNQDLDRAILESMTSNYDEQNRLQKEIEKMKAYYSNLVKSKNAEMESLIRELSGKDHYMSTALSFNSSLAVTKTALDEATTTLDKPNRIISHSTSFRILSPSAGNADKSPAANLVQSPTSAKSPSVRSPPPSMKRSTSFLNQAFEKNVESDEVIADFSTKELCDYYEIDSVCIFEGEKMKKKFSTDFMYKDSYLWIIPSSRSLHWGKSAADIVNPKSSKYILLDSSNKSATGRVLPPGEHKGTLKSVESSDAGIVITTQNEDFLEMKVPQQTVRDWVQVLRAFML